MNNFYKKRNTGSAMTLTVVFFLAVGLIIISSVSASLAKDIKNQRNLFSGKVSYYVSEAGIEDTSYRLKNAINVSNNTLTIDGKTSFITITDLGNGQIQILSTASTSDYYKKIKINLTSGTGISFHYGIQAGLGGFSLANSSNIVGNVYSEGLVAGSGSNLIYGDVVSSGATGSVYGIHATGSVYSHSIGIAGKATTIDKNAYYQNITNTTVAGTQYPNSADQPHVPLPITDAQIQEWEDDALAGGVMSSSSCDSFNSSSNTCTINTDKTLGPKKIPFNLLIKSTNKILTVAGALWITGNIDAETSPVIKMASSLGSSNVAIIADNPSNRLTSSIVTLGQSTTFQGSGFPNSFVFIISQNNSAENGGSTAAINPGQSSSALVMYASHGLITLSQSVKVKEVTAYKIALSQSSSVTYDTGLSSLIFSSGPTGGFGILGWTEQ